MQQGENFTGLRFTIKDKHCRSHRAEERGRNTKSSVLQQQVGFVRCNKGTKCVEERLEGKSTFLVQSKTATSLIGSGGRKCISEGGNAEKKHKLQCEYKKRKEQRDKYVIANGMTNK